MYLPAANRELRAVSSYLNVDPITGPDATKEKFKSSVENATVIHLGNIETLKDYNWNNDTQDHWYYVLYLATQQTVFICIH